MEGVPDNSFQKYENPPEIIPYESDEEELAETLEWQKQLQLGSMTNSRNEKDALQIAKNEARIKELEEKIKAKNNKEIIH